MGGSDQHFQYDRSGFGDFVSLSRGHTHQNSGKNDEGKSLYLKADPMRQQAMGSYGHGAPPCIIYHPGRSAVQSAPLRNSHWVLEFEKTGHDGTDDPFGQIRLVFPDRQSAVYYARRQGLECRVFPDSDKN